MNYLSEEIEVCITEIREARERLNVACKAYGAWIRTERMARRMSLKHLSKEIGSSAPFLFDVEHGNRKLCKLMRDAVDVVFETK